MNQSKAHNKSIHADCQKWRGFRYATAAPLLSSGDAKRWQIIDFMLSYIMREKSIHFEEMLNERMISVDWVDLTLISPDKVEVHEDGTVHYIKKIAGYDNRWLRVVVNEEITPNKLVTAFFDRRLRRKNHES